MLGFQIVNTLLVAADVAIDCAANAVVHDVTGLFKPFVQIDLVYFALETTQVTFIVGDKVR